MLNLLVSTGQVPAGSPSQMTLQNITDRGGMIQEAPSPVYTSQPGQAMQEKKGTFWGELGKAITSFGKSMETPGFQHMIGNLIQAIAFPGSPQQKIGQFIAGRGEARAFKETMAGRPSDVLSPEQQTEAGRLRSMIDYQKAISEAAMPWEERRDIEMAQVYAQLAGIRPPTPTMPKIEMLPKGTMEYPVVVTPEGITQIPEFGGPRWQEKKEGEISPEKQLTEARYWYDRSYTEALQSPELQTAIMTGSAQMIVDPKDPTGKNKIIVWKDPKEGRKILNKLQREALARFAKEGLVPASYMDLVPAIEEEPEVVPPPTEITPEGEKPKTKVIWREDLIKG